MLLGALVTSLDEISCNIDSQHVCAELCLGQSRGAIAAPEIQHLHSFPDSKFLHERLAALAHGVRDACEIAFFPERLVRIRRSIHDATLSLPARSRNDFGEPVFWGAHASTRVGAGVLAIADFSIETRSLPALSRCYPRSYYLLCR